LIEFEDHTLTPQMICFTANNRQLVTGTSKEGCFRLYDLEESRQKRKFGNFPRYSRLIANASGSRIAVFGVGNQIRLWDTQSQTAIAEFNAHTEVVTSLAFQEGSHRILSGDSSGMCLLWSEQQADAVGHWQMASSITSIEITRDGSQFVCQNWDSGHIWLQDMRPEKTEPQLIRNETFPQYGGGLKFLHGGDRLVTSSSRYGVRVWDVDAGTVLLTLLRETANPATLKLSDDGTRIASVDSQGNVLIWNGAPLSDNDRK